MSRLLLKNEPMGTVTTSRPIESASSDVGEAPRPPSLAQHLSYAITDLARGVSDWRLWILLGMNDIRQRYRRARLGQFWITLAMATQIISMGILYAYLFRTKPGEYLPNLGASYVVWGLISSIVTDSCSVFIGAEGYMRQVPMPKSIFVHRMLVRNGIVFLHNLLILPPLFLFYGTPIGWALVLAPLGMALILVNGVWLGLLLGTICARFRDLPQIIASLMQVIFFLTPIIWRPQQLPQRIDWLIDWNPFESFLEIVRSPLLGMPPPLLAWEIAVCMTAGGFIVSLLFFARFRARIIYWL